MKKSTSLLLALVIVLMCFSLTACGDCDHSYGNWTTTKTATCTEDGQKERTCSECGHVDSQEIKAPGHDYVDGICTECGGSQ